MTKNTLYFLSFAFCAFLFLTCPVSAQDKPGDVKVKQASPNGFDIELTRELQVGGKSASKHFVSDFSKWYDAAHSYSQKSENLSIDLEKHCMLEKLPEGGFVRHMELVFYQPGKTIRLTGGLGPLQGMGVSGALTVTFVADGDSSKVVMTYNVTGADHSQLDKIAKPVAMVLGGQFDRFQKFCNEQKK